MLRHTSSFARHFVNRHLEGERSAGLGFLRLGLYAQALFSGLDLPHGMPRTRAWGWVVRYAASRGTAASAVLRGGAKDLRFTIYEIEVPNLSETRSRSTCRCSLRGRGGAITDLGSSSCYRTTYCSIIAPSINILRCGASIVRAPSMLRS